MTALAPPVVGPVAGPVQAPARSVRACIESFDAAAAGEALYAAVRELYPLCRSLTGNGVRRSLEILGRGLPLEVWEVPTGTRVHDWVIPREWNLRAARLTAPDGTVVADAAKLNLHVVGYSSPFRGQLSLEELQPHLHSLPEQPHLVPYRHTYHREGWGFCLSHAARAALPEGTYDVLVDTTLEPGALTLGQVVLPGARDATVLFSAHVCHPSLANDNLSGLVVGAALARALAGASLDHTYRFLFAPVTLGAIAWLALDGQAARRVEHGVVLAGLGDAGGFTWKKSRRGDAEVDRAAALVLRHCGEPFALREFSPDGYDERQYCSPGYDLPVGRLSRTPHGEYPGYHTSGDDLALVQPGQLAAALLRCLELVEVLEGNGRYQNLSPRGEPHLGRRGLFGLRAPPWVLSFSDGAHSLLDIAERAKLPFHEVLQAARALQAVGLLGPAREQAKEAR